MGAMAYGSIVILLFLILLKLWQVQATLARLSQNQYRIILKLGIEPERFDPPSDEVRVLAQQPGKQVEALRAYRKQTGAGLKDAQAAINSLQAGARN